MATTLTLRLTTRGQNLKGQLAVECKVKGTSTRHYKVVQNLKSPAYSPDCWNEKQGLFIAGENAAYNNQVTKSLLDALNTMLSAGNYQSGKQLFEAYEYAQICEFSDCQERRLNKRFHYVRIPPLKPRPGFCLAVCDCKIIFF